MQGTLNSAHLAWIRLPVYQGWGRTSVGGQVFAPLFVRWSHCQLLMAWLAKDHWCLRHSHLLTSFLTSAPVSCSLTCLFSYRESSVPSSIIIIIIIIFIWVHEHGPGHFSLCIPLDWLSKPLPGDNSALPCTLDSFLRTLTLGLLFSKILFLLERSTAPHRLCYAIS